MHEIVEHALALKTLSIFKSPQGAVSSGILPWIVG